MTEREPGDEPDGTEPEPSGAAPADPLTWFTRPARPVEPTPAADPPESAAPPAPVPARPASPTPFDESEPTQMMDAIELEPDPPAVPPPAIGPVVPPSAVGAPSEPEDPTSALDALFGDERFREYESDLAPTPGESPFARRPAAPAEAATTVLVPDAVTAPPAPPRAKGPAISMSRTQKTLLGVLVGLLAVLALVALFFLGTRLAEMFGPAPAIVASPSASPTPSAVAPIVFVPGPVAPGDYEWDELLGGECLDPYTTPWAEEFTVVDCATPHTAQVAFRGVLANAAGTPDFPGVDAIAAQIGSICAAPGVVDLATAGAVTDAQVQGSYPVTEEEWDVNPAYFCFVSRSSGEPLTGSIAVPQTAAPVPYPITGPTPVATAAPTTP